MNTIKPDKTLDCIGLYCPQPLFQTRTTLDSMQTGEILEVLADDPASEEDITRLLKRIGQELVSFDNNDGDLRFIIKKVK